MDLFVLDKIVLGIITSIPAQKIFIYLVGLMVGVFLYTGSKQKKKASK